MQIRSVVDVDDAAVQGMVESSLEHAFDNLHARRWVEAKVRATETVAATRKGLTNAATGLDPATRARIEGALAATEAALAAEETPAGTGDVEGLKAAVKALDEATRPLADLLMDQAMEAMLRKRGMIQ